MTSHLWLPQPMPVPPPSEVVGYLLGCGWSFVDANPRWAVYRAVLNAQEVTLEVPQQAAATDYGRAVGMLIEDLARLEQRPATSVLRDIHASSVDVIRLGLEGGLTRDGRIPVEAGRRVYDAARDLLLAAACSVIEPRAAHAPRKPEEAMRVINMARFGLAEVGSYVVTIECAVPPRLQLSLPLDDGDPDAPIGRRAFATVATALRAADGAARESAASGQFNPFQARTRDGVSANLCDALAEVIEAASADVLRADFSFASRRPLGGDIPRRVVISADVSPILREGARGLREKASYPAFEVLGTVVKLGSPDATEGGEAVLRAVLEGRPAHVKARLAPADYKIAIQAHADRTLVRCVGDLVREGRSWLLENPHPFETVADPGEP